MRRALVAIAALVLAIATGTVGADAASLGTITTRMFSAGGTVTYAPADRTVSNLTVATTGSPATLTAATLLVSGTSIAQLDGQSITLLLLDATTTPVRTVTATLTAGTTLTLAPSSATITVPIPGATARSAVTAWAVFIAGTQVLPFGASSTTRSVTVGDGSIPVVPWTEQVVTEGNINVEVDSVALTTNSPSQVCFVVTIRGTSALLQPWVLKLDFGQPPFYGVVPSQVQRAVVQSTAGTVWTLVGNDNGNDAPYEEWGNNDKLTNAMTHTVTVCQYQGGIAPDRPEAYTVSGAAVPSGSWTAGTACKSVTVTGNGLYPFYFGWRVTIDMTDAFAHLVASKSVWDTTAPDAFDYTPDPYTPAFGAGTTVYTVSNYRDDSLTGTQSKTVVLCARNY